MYKFFAKIKKSLLLRKKAHIFELLFVTMMKQILFSIVFLSLFLCSCGNTSKNSGTDFPSDSTMTLHYAKGFRVSYFADYKKVELLLRDGQVSERYYLVREAQTAVPTDGVKIQIPLTKIAVGSATHLEFLSILGEQNSIAGVCSPHLVYNDSVAKAFADGRIEDLGDAFSLNLERLIFLRPDVIFVSGFDAGQQDGNRRIMQTGVPVVSNNEWRETTLLGRAEWIKFMATFFDKEAEAEAFFANTVFVYQTLKAKVDSAALSKPDVMLGGGFKGTWYVPSGRSFMSRLLQDARANYAFSNDTAYESLPLSFEQVLLHFSNADVWVGAPAQTLAELKSIDERYAMFAPVRKGEVYNFEARTTPAGANDFWESGVAYPERILADLIKVFHPQLLPEYELFYVKKLN